MFNTTGRAYIYVVTGHGAWEAAVTNVLSKSDRNPGAGERPLPHRLGRERAICPNAADWDASFVPDRPSCSCYILMLACFTTLAHVATSSVM